LPCAVDALHKPPEKTLWYLFVRKLLTGLVVVQASPEDVGSAARLDFYRQVLHQLRGHVAVRDRILNLPLARERGKKSTDPAEWLEMRDEVSYALDLLGVKAVCIDEAKHLMPADAA